MTTDNILYYGDNLGILRRKVADGTVLTVAELLEGKQVQLPALRHVTITYQRGQRATRDPGMTQGNLLEG